MIDQSKIRNFSIPFGLLHAPDPAPPVAKFLRAVAKAVKAREGL